MKKLIAFGAIAAGCLCLRFSVAPAAAQDPLQLFSPAFGHNQLIPEKYTCQGMNVNPELAIENLPAGTQSLVLIVDDPDAPVGTWVHWVVYDIAPTDRIAENSVPGIEGWNSFNRQSYGGPCPPSGTHRYFFKLYALDIKLELPEGQGKQAIESAMQRHILARAELIGLYKQK
ncbi:MAG TPA: YbhB/YbcL family Raf kinase inhibitor-like protein [Candidatus Omnitrophota bacterium]|nr:YbhB/YbcL family Raf kinase inhibitor-like protein [Candidatus Omnitrophota bacterium]HRZ14368.1 YbhB/YbcL family Raf kinase inhibitor-like protein [Candidatus Omnitrophota bacterium]